jgi:hypothetical protein
MHAVNARSQFRVGVTVQDKSTHSPSSVSNWSANVEMKTLSILSQMLCVAASSRSTFNRSLMFGVCRLSGNYTICCLRKKLGCWCQLPPICLHQGPSDERQITHREVWGSASCLRSNRPKQCALPEHSKLNSGPCEHAERLVLPIGQPVVDGNVHGCGHKLGLGRDVCKSTQAKHESDCAAIVGQRASVQSREEEAWEIWRAQGNDRLGPCNVGKCKVAAGRDACMDGGTQVRGGRVVVEVPQESGPPT